jgi:PKD repeat protein
LKTKKSNISVRELFKRRLEGVEVIPDSYINARLMRTLARREFVRFNPARFNAYYLGGIIAVGVTAGIMLFSDKHSNTRITPSEFSDTTVQSQDTGYFNIPEGNTIKKVPLIQEEIKGKPKINNNNPTEVVKPEINGARITNPGVKNTIVPAGITKSYSKNGLFGDTSSSPGKLQSRNTKGDILFEPSAHSGCIPLSIHFQNNVSAFDSCYWAFGDGGFSGKKNPDWIFDMEGNYNVVLTIFFKNGQQSTYSTTITVYPKPLARFEISPEKAILPYDEIRFSNYSTDGKEFKWDFGDGNSSELFEPYHKYSKSGNYNIILTVTSEFGCKDSLKVLNAFSGSEYFIEFPNAFIPNENGPSGGLYSSKSDEAAQVFHPSFSGVSDYQLKIFSKLGILIYESNDVNIGWDGYFKGQLANPGVYIWKVRGSFRNGEPFTRMGDVTLLRN